MRSEKSKMNRTPNAVNRKPNTRVLNNKKTVVLLSGGLDSATTLYIAKDRGLKYSVLTFDYGQRHRKEVRCAQNLAKKAHVPWQLIRFNLPWKGSTLIDKKKVLPQGRTYSAIKRDIPSTYVPARNTIFLSFAISFAEVIGAEFVYIGANAVDFSGYPDCRPGYFKVFDRLIVEGTKLGSDGKSIKIETPLLYKSKGEIIKWGVRLNVPFELTWSCYKGAKLPCGKCDSCILRAKGFQEAGIRDPIIKIKNQKSKVKNT